MSAQMREYIHRNFRPLREWFEFAVEWQKATGVLLMSEDRTKSLGQEKIKDAEARREAYRFSFGQRL